MAGYLATTVNGPLIAAMSAVLQVQPLPAQLAEVVGKELLSTQSGG